MNSYTYFVFSKGDSIELCEFCQKRTASHCENPQCGLSCCHIEDGRHGYFQAGNINKFYCQNCGPKGFYEVCRMCNSMIDINSKYIYLQDYLRQTCNFLLPFPDFGNPIKQRTF